MASASLRRVVLSLLLLFGWLTAWAGAAHAEERVAVHLFWAEGCPHCVKAKAFLAEFALRKPWVNLRLYEVAHDSANMALFQETSRRLGETSSGVPFTVVCDRATTGWLSDETTGADIEAMAEQAHATGCLDMVAAPSARPPPAAPAPAPDIRAVPETFRLPLVGTVRTADLSLPLLTVLFAAVDGFNPCAMWVLVFLIGLLVGLGDRRRMWILGGVFLLASAGMYYAVLAAWVNVLLALGYLRWLRAIIGLVALAGGGYWLRQYATERGGTCAVTGGKGRQQVLGGLRALSRERNLWLAATGIALLAVAVNFIELICSAGLPAVFTQVLALNRLPAWQYHAYIGLYIAVFLLDDAAVFVTAMVTLRAAGLSGRYSRFSHLLGGAILVGVGLLLLFKPGWLMFG